MFDYWKKRGLVQVRKLDDSVAQAMWVASSPQEWHECGKKNNFEMETMCLRELETQCGRNYPKLLREKWGPLVVESGESSGWEDEVWWCDGGGRAKGRRSGNSVKVKGLSMDDGPDAGNAGEASSFVTSNVGKRVAYPVVENYVKNTFGLVKSMMIKDMHFFKFGSKEGMEAMASYDKAMNELKVDVDLRDTNVVVVPKCSGEGFTTSTIRVEYEWTPPRCPECKVQTANKATTPVFNSFNALSTLVDEEEGGGNQTHSTNATHMVANINELKRQMLDGKHVLVDEHGKPLEMKVTNEASASKPSMLFPNLDLMP
ncbi:hypothetical protein Tco_1110878 [Tanacetum coccineum]|uniref:Uncharacterized protein n=1 Tax=Tanacetum coccineum TaxID=301880 RepID=A0ABQ5IK29_9ASTR